MLQFIVLGYIPGTSIQINFIGYLLGVCLSFAVCSIAWWLSLRMLRSRAKRIVAMQLISL